MYFSVLPESLKKLAERIVAALNLEAARYTSDGSFYAEYDLFCPHPTDARWFVEMVTSWGRGDKLKVEAQMIRSLADA
jgi:hypothetical protein